MILTVISSSPPLWRLDERGETPALLVLWPDRLDRVQAAATGPAVLLSPQEGQQNLTVPAQLPVCCARHAAAIA